MFLPVFPTAYSVYHIQLFLSTYFFIYFSFGFQPSLLFGLLMHYNSLSFLWQAFFLLFLLFFIILYYKMETEARVSILPLVFLLFYIKKEAPIMPQFKYLNILYSDDYLLIFSYNSTNSTAKSIQSNEVIKWSCACTINKFKGVFSPRISP